MRTNALTWEVRSRKDGSTLVVFTGEVDERFEFSALSKLKGSVTLDLAGVRRLNSEGVRRWINFMRSLVQVTELSLVRCSVPVVTQINMIGGFTGRGRVKSFYAPYLCYETGEEQERLLTREEIQDPSAPPSFPCEGGTLQLDDIPERYFAFLQND